METGSRNTELGNLKNKVGEGKREIKLLKGRLASGIGSQGRRSWTLGERVETTLGDLFKEQKTNKQKTPNKQKMPNKNQTPPQKKKKKQPTVKTKGDRGC